MTHRITAWHCCLVLLAALFVCGCGGGGGTTPPAPPVDNRQIGKLAVTLDWPRSRAMPQSATTVRINIYDSKGQTQILAVNRPASPAETSVTTFENVAVGAIRVSAVAMSAPDSSGIPIAWGNGVAALAEKGTTTTTSLIMSNPIAWDGDMAGLTTKPRLITGQLRYASGADTPAVPGNWSWDAPLKDPVTGANLTDPDNIDFNTGRAFAFITAGGQFYIYYFPGAKTPVQVPLIPDWVSYWGLSDGQALTRQQLQLDVPGFKSQYLTVTPGAVLKTDDKGSILLTPGTPGGGAGIVIQ